MKLAAYQRNKVIKSFLHKGRDLPCRGLTFVAFSFCIAVAWCIFASYSQSSEAVTCSTDVPSEPIPQENLPSYPGPPGADTTKSLPCSTINSRL